MLLTVTAFVVAILLQLGVEPCGRIGTERHPMSLVSIKGENKERKKVRRT